MPRVLLFFIWMNFSFIFSQQMGMGQWYLHISSKEAVGIARYKESIYCAFKTGVVEYHTTSKEVSMWTAVNSLSDIGLTTIVYSEEADALYIGYENGNIDKIKNGRVINIPAIKIAQLQGDKKIYSIYEYGGYVYFTTGFGIVKVDPLKDEVKDTYYPTGGNLSIIDMEVKNDSIYALSEDRLYVGYVNSIALSDSSQWYISSVLPLASLPDRYAAIEKSHNDSLYVLYQVDGYGKDSVYRLNTTGKVSLFPNDDFEIQEIVNVEGNLAVCLDYGGHIYDKNLNDILWVGQYTFGGLTRISDMIYYGESYWIADRDEGLVEFKNSWNNHKISIVGPKGDEFYSLNGTKHTMAIAAGRLSGGVFSTYSQEGVHIYNGEEETWIIKSKGNVVPWQGKDIWDFVSVAINPNNDNQIAIGTYSKVPLTIMDIEGSSVQLFDSNNSPLSPVGNNPSNNTAVTHMEYDENGNLWMINDYTSSPLKVYTSSGEWYSFPVHSSAYNQIAFDLEIDYNGNKWFAIRGKGLFGLHDNGTISNTSDDKVVYLNTGELTGKLPSNQVNAIAVDFDNEIWVGTDNGFAILYNSEGAFDAGPGDYNVQRIKLEYEGNVEYMLGATNITDIEVDGGNRKWIATSNSGLILLSESGTEILQQFTEENSPLISNNIFDIEFNHITGELFIITDKGLLTYRADASYEDPEYSNVVVFPNPVRPDFEGVVSIQGIRYNSDVKITDIAGNLIYKTTSNGGTATWNIKNIDGMRVPGGVYLIWTAANEGKGRFVGKVLVISNGN